MGEPAALYSTYAMLISHRLKDNSGQSGLRTAILATAIVLASLISSGQDSHAENQEGRSKAVTSDAPLGVSWPGSTPELFAPGVVNTDSIEINLVFSRDYTELFFSRIVNKLSYIFTCRLIDGAWTAPERLELMPEGGEAVDMALSPDEQSLYFLGITPDGNEAQSDIWVSDRTDEGWSRARRLGPSVNTKYSEFYPTVVADGSLYFVSDRPSELGPRNPYRASRRADGTFEAAVPVGPPINTKDEKDDTYVAPDESYLIFKSNSREVFGSGDLFIAFRTPDGGWTEPKNMGPTINSKELDFCPMVSPDGRWFSFSRRYGDSWPTTTDADIYWMSASIIEQLRDE